MWFHWFAQNHKSNDTSHPQTSPSSLPGNQQRQISSWDSFQLLWAFSTISPDVPSRGGWTRGESLQREILPSRNWKGWQPFHSWQTSVLWGNGVWEQFRKSRWDFTCSASSTLLSILIVLLTSLKRKGVKLLWASSLLLEGAMALEMWCWQRPRRWLCRHLIYWAMGEQLWCLPQNDCRNPELELSLNLRCPPCPLQGSCSCWQGILACHALFALCNFIHLFRKKGCFMGKHKMQVQKSFVISVKKHFLIKTLSVTILWIVLVLGFFITNTSSGGV